MKIFILLGVQLPHLQETDGTDSMTKPGLREIVSKLPLHTTNIAKIDFLFT